MFETKLQRYSLSRTDLCHVTYISASEAALVSSCFDPVLVLVFLCELWIICLNAVVKDHESLKREGRNRIKDILFCVREKKVDE